MAVKFLLDPATGEFATFRTITLTLREELLAALKSVARSNDQSPSEWANATLPFLLGTTTPTASTTETSSPHRIPTYGP